MAVATIAVIFYFFKETGAQDEDKKSNDSSSNSVIQDESQITPSSYAPSALDNSSSQSSSSSPESTKPTSSRKEVYWNPNDSDKRKWPTTVFEKEMNDSANDFVKELFNPEIMDKDKWGEFRNRIDSVKARRGLYSIRYSLSNLKPKGAAIVDKGYSDAIYEVVFNEEDQPYSYSAGMSRKYITTYRFAIKMNPITKEWKVTQFVQESNQVPS